jgi:hypothetical protein
MNEKWITLMKSARQECTSSCVGKPKSGKMSLRWNLEMQVVGMKEETNWFRITTRVDRWHSNSDGGWRLALVFPRSGHLMTNINHVPYTSNKTTYVAY